MTDLDAPSTGESYFIRHWRGHLSLTKSFWINLIAVNVITMIVFQVAAIVIYNSDMGGLGAFVLLTTFLITFVIWLWSATGVWRAADRYSKRPGSGIWGMAACWVVVLQGLSWLAQAPNAFS